MKTKYKKSIIIFINLVLIILAWEMLSINIPFKLKILTILFKTFIWLLAILFLYIGIYYIKNINRLSRNYTKINTNKVLSQEQIQQYKDQGYTDEDIQNAIIEISQEKGNKPLDKFYHNYIG